MSTTPSTLPQLLSGAASRFGDRAALGRVTASGPEAGMTYATLAHQAERFARILVRLGVRQGDRVMIISENRVQWPVAYFGVSLAGAIAVPVLVDFSPEQVTHVASHAGVVVACVSDKTLQKVEGLEASVPRVLLDTIDGSGVDVIGHPDYARTHMVPDAGTGPLPGSFLQADDLACILYTSGTSGHSKGVMLTHGNLVSNVIATADVFPLRPEDRVLSVMPLAHTLESTMGMLTPLYQGSSIYYLDKPPTAPVLSAALKAVQPTVMVAVPLIIEKVYRGSIEPRLKSHPLYRFAPTRLLAVRAAGRKLEEAFGGNIRFFGIGGAALARDVEEFLSAAGFPYAIGYGLTETSPLIAAAVPGKTAVGSTGIILSGLSVRIARQMPVGKEDAPDGTLADGGNGHGSQDTAAARTASGAQLAAVGEEGEIQVTGPSVMRGYYRDEARTAEVFTSDGWFRTGDLGTFDRQGRLYIRGRLKAMILGPSGENIYPEEIESALAATGFVEESLVYAARDGALVAMVVLNERTKAMLNGTRQAMGNALQAIDHTRHALDDTARETAAGVEHLLGQLRSTVNRRLSSFSRISRIVIREAPFEKTATLKIKRYLYPEAGA